MKREINVMSIRLLILCAALIWLSSCTNYQYIHLSSELPKTSDTEHYYISDSLIYVDFDFNGNRLPVKLYFLNESEIPVYFDLTETLFFENDNLVRSAHGLTNGELEEMILIPAGKGATFKFWPYQSEMKPLMKAQSNYVEISNGSKRESVAGLKMEEQGRTFEIRIAYSTDEDGQDKTSLKANFKEDFIYFTTRTPESFPGGSSPYCYYVSEGSEGGQLAASLLFEVASASLYYLMLESLD